MNGNAAPLDESAGVRTRPGRAEDAKTLAQMMFVELPWARIRDLGLPFVTLIHHALLTSPHAISLVAERDGKIIGYCAGVVDTDLFNKEFKRRYGLKSAFLILPRLISPRNWGTVWKGLTYYEELEPGDPKSEISAFAVDSAVKGAGIGRRLFQEAMDLLKARGATGCRLGTADVKNDRANAFYKKYGFEIARTVPFYKDSMVNIYIYKFDHS